MNRPPKWGQTRTALTNPASKVVLKTANHNGCVPHTSHLHATGAFYINKSCDAQGDLQVIGICTTCLFSSSGDSFLAKPLLRSYTYSWTLSSCANNPAVHVDQSRAQSGEAEQGLPGSSIVPRYNTPVQSTGIPDTELKQRSLSPTGERPAALRSTKVVHDQPARAHSHWFRSKRLKVHLILWRTIGATSTAQQSIDNKPYFSSSVICKCTGHFERPFANNDRGHRCYVS